MIGSSVLLESDEIPILDALSLPMCHDVSGRYEGWRERGKKGERGLS